MYARSTSAQPSAELTTVHKVSRLARDGTQGTSGRADTREQMKRAYANEKPRLELPSQIIFRAFPPPPPVVLDTATKVDRVISLGARRPARIRRPSGRAARFLPASRSFRRPSPSPAIRIKRVPQAVLQRLAKTARGRIEFKEIYPQTNSTGGKRHGKENEES